MQLATQHSIDLHCHSVYSDGSLTLSELVEHVVQFGVETLSITDHDSIGIHHEIAQSGLALPCNVLPGIEISCSFNNREVHIVGLNVNINDTGLCDFVSRQQDCRRERLLNYAYKLEKVGLKGVDEQVTKLSAEAVTRTHLSQILVNMGYVQDANRAFKKYIGRKGRAYVAMQWPSIQDVVEVIVNSGGVAVIAHPGRYQLSRKQLELLMIEFVEAKGQAIELSYPNIEPQLIHWLTDKALSLNMYASQGSDFHNPQWRWVKPGFFPPLPKAAPPVWQLWQ